MSPENKFSKKFTYDKRDFLFEALTCDIENNPILKKPNRYQLTDDMWSKDVDITFSAVFGNKNRSQLATDLGVSRVTIHKIIKRTVTSIWDNCPEELKQKYPLEELTKPYQDIGSVKAARISEQVTSMLKSGFTETEILDKLSMTPKEFYDLRRYSAKKYEIVLPSLRRKKTK